MEELRVVELAGSIAGAWCAKLFVDAGAHVALTHSDGATLGHPGYERFLHRGKHLLSDLPDLNDIDVVIESSAPNPLTLLAETPDQTIQVLLSPLGTHGPRSSWSSSDITDYALSGHQYLYGDPDREPLRGPPDQPAVAAGIYGFIGAMSALIARDRGAINGPQTVEVSHVEAMIALHQFTLIRQQMSGSVLKRMGNRYTGQGQPNSLYRCADGWVAVTCITSAQVDTLLSVADLHHLCDDERITSMMDFMDHPQLMDVPLRAWFGEQHVDEVVDLLQTLRIPAAPNRTMTELLTEPQLVARNFWQEDTNGASIQLPRPPTRVTRHPTTVGRQLPPVETGSQPLAGLKVLDLTRVWAGPLCTRTLADLGAEVTMIEAPWSRGPQKLPQSVVTAARYYPDDQAGTDPWNRNAHVNKYAIGKRSLALDLSCEQGRDVLAQLVPHYDVLVENYSTRVMPQLGFDEQRLHQLNPDLIYLTMPGFGRSGPAEHWVSYGSSVDSHAGLSSLIGYPDESPWKGGVAWPDPVAGLQAAGAVLVALRSREASSDTGGATLEHAQFESMVHAIGHLVARAQLEGDPRPQGNADNSYALQGTWQCAGLDAWVSISAADEAGASRLASLVGASSTTSLAEAVAMWCAERTPAEAAIACQGASITAGEVHTAADVHADRHGKVRGMFATVEQPSVGPFTVAATPVHSSSEMVRALHPAPTLGQHNQQVLAEIGMTRADITDLLDAGVIADRPPR